MAFYFGVVICYFCLLVSSTVLINSFPPSAAHTRQYWFSLFGLFGAKPLLPEPMLACCRLGSWEQIVVIVESEFYQFHFFFQENVFQNVVCRNGDHFVQGEMS